MPMDGFTENIPGLEDGNADRLGHALAEGLRRMEKIEQNDVSLMLDHSPVFWISRHLANFSSTFARSSFCTGLPR